MLQEQCLPDVIFKMKFALHLLDYFIIISFIFQKKDIRNLCLCFRKDFSECRI